MAIAFQTGQKFRFKGEEESYTFLGIIEDGQQLVVAYEDQDGNEKRRGIVFLSDLEHVFLTAKK